VSKVKVIIVGGGTGGHLYPGIALAQEFKRKDADNQILFVGTRRGLEQAIVPREGFALKTLWIDGLVGMPWHKVLMGLLKLPIALLQSFKILVNFRPHLVVGVGGYVTGPFMLAAFLWRVPQLIQEQNVFPGTTNRILAYLVDRIAISFARSEAYFPSKKVQLTGNPIRQEFLGGTKNGSRSSHSLGRTFHLLVFGGSQGAHQINVAMIEALPHLESVKECLQIVHQTGTQDFAWVEENYQKAGWEKTEILNFIYDMAIKYNDADLIVCRAGATTLAEITVAGKPAIMIPFPLAVHNHQEINAGVLEEIGAAQIIHNHELTGKRLAQAVLSLINTPEKLIEMGERGKELGRADAAEQVVKMGYELIHVM